MTRDAMIERTEEEWVKLVIAAAKIINPIAGWNGPGWKHAYDSHEEAAAACEAARNAAIAKAESILALASAKIDTQAAQSRIQALTEGLEQIAEEGDAEINPQLLLEGCREIARALLRPTPSEQDPT